MKTPAPKLKSQILEEASHWFVELNQADNDATLRAQFDAWLRRSPEHVQAFLQITTLWENAELLAKGRTMSTDELIARPGAGSNVVPFAEIMPASAVTPSHDVTRSGTEGSGLRSRAFSRTHALAALAAGMVLAVLIGVPAYLYTQRGTYATDIGEQRSIALDDGSTIELNSGSKLRVRYDHERRSVELKRGQALFRVAHDAARPFIVRSNGTEVRAVGTQFDIYRKTTSTVVTVLEGKVAVSSLAVPAPEPHDSAPTSRVRVKARGRRGELSLIAGEQLTIQVPTLAAAERDADPGAPATPAAATDIKSVDPSVATAWIRRQLVFNATPLGEVIEEFNRYNARPIVMTDADLQATRITGVFASTDPKALLTFIRDLPDVSVEETSEEIRISKKRG